MTAGAWRAADIRRRFAGLARSPAAGADRGDHDLNPNMRAPEDMRDAAVLVPLVDRPEGLTILLTKRTPHLSKHAGQIAFPGGRAEEHDADMVATALRETEEEIGLTRDRIEPVGRLDRYATRTGYIVTPIVAIVHPPFTLALDRHEVADAFEAPLSFFLDAANRVREEGVYKGESRAFYVFPYRDRRIWGATAGMLVNLADLLAG